MRISPNTKFILINVLFFGVIGSLLGGVLPALLGLGMYDSMMERSDQFFTSYVIGSLAVGFLPATITGFFYSGMYRREFMKVGLVDFWKEIKFGALASFLTILGLTFLMFIIICIDILQQGNLTLDKIGVALATSSLIGLFFMALGVFSGMLCSNLIREWNQKLVKNL